MILGIVFVIVGVLGFIENPIVGEYGYFMTNAVHNLAHLLIGIIMLVMASKGEASAAMSMTIFGVVYLLLAVLGFVMSSPLLGLVEYNAADNWLHVVLGVVLLVLGMTNKGSAPAMPSSGMGGSGMGGMN